MQSAASLSAGWAPATRRSVIWILIFALLLASPAWAILGLFEKKPPKIRGAVVAETPLNTVSSGESTSVVLRVFELTSDNAFGQQDFFGLYRSAKEVLGDEFRRVDELVILPESITLIPERELDPDTTHIGLLAAYRDWEKAEWRALLELPDKKEVTIHIQMYDNVVNVTVEKKRWWKKIRKKAEDR